MCLQPPRETCWLIGFTVGNDFGLATSNFNDRTALNRTTFGARQSDLDVVQHHGWENWIEDQLTVPAGDDPELQSYLDAQVMRISYLESVAEDAPIGTWQSVEEFRPLSLLKADRQAITDLINSDPLEVHNEERNRLYREALVSSAIRAAHSRYQLREVMVDFWRNHFSIPLVSSAIAYERNVLRPNVLGNFAEFVEATAASPEMLAFLNNQDSRADKPNENYARELLELHTMGANAYRGIVNPDQMLPVDVPGGFTDTDIVNGANALSGWTINYGTGQFRFEPQFHSESAKLFLGQPIGHLQGIEQGQFVIERAAMAPETAQFICHKITSYLIGSPVPSVIDRAMKIWNANLKSHNQIELVVREILLGGDEIGDPSLGRVRRPLEQVFAMHRALEIVLRTQDMDSDFNMYRHLDRIRDRPFGWATPEGRPLTDEYALSTSGVHSAYLTKIEPLFDTAHFRVSLTDQSPQTHSVIELVEYWMNRMIGEDLSPESYNAVLDWASRPDGLSGILVSRQPVSFRPDGDYDWNDPGSALEVELRRLVFLISNLPEFLRR